MAGKQFKNYAFEKHLEAFCSSKYAPSQNIYVWLNKTTDFYNIGFKNPETNKPQYVHVNNTLLEKVNNNLLNNYKTFIPNYQLLSHEKNEIKLYRGGKFEDLRIIRELDGSVPFDVCYINPDCDVKQTDMTAQDADMAWDMFEQVIGASVYNERSNGGKGLQGLLGVKYSLSSSCFSKTTTYHEAAENFKSTLKKFFELFTNICKLNGISISEFEAKGLPSTLKINKEGFVIEYVRGALGQIPRHLVKNSEHIQNTGVVSFEKIEELIKVLEEKLQSVDKPVLKKVKTSAGGSNRFSLENINYGSKADMIDFSLNFVNKLDLQDGYAGCRHQVGVTQLDFAQKIVEGLAVAGHNGRITTATAKITAEECKSKLNRQFHGSRNATVMTVLGLENILCMNSEDGNIYTPPESSTTNEDGEVVALKSKACDYVLADFIVEEYLQFLENRYGKHSTVSSSLQSMLSSLKKTKYTYLKAQRNSKVHCISGRNCFANSLFT